MPLARSGEVALSVREIDRVELGKERFCFIH
jgi:hypothetical protein